MSHIHAHSHPTQSVRSTRISNHSHPFIHLWCSTRESVGISNLPKDLWTTPELQSPIWCHITNMKQLLCTKSALVIELKLIFMPQINEMLKFLDFQVNLIFCINWYWLLLSFCCDDILYVCCAHRVFCLFVGSMWWCPWPILWPYEVVWSGRIAQ